MPTIVTALTDPARNSYLSLEDANTYHDERLHSEAWTGEEDDDQKRRALIWATHILDNTFRWRGYRVEEEQPLQFPRYGISDYDGWLLSEKSIPRKVQDATAELALELLSGDRTLNDEPGSAGIRELKVGSVELKFDPKDRPGIISSPIRDMLSEFIYVDLDRRDGGTVTLVRT